MNDEQTDQIFRETVWVYYRQHGRHGLPWRQPEAGGSFDPYKILVSEVMLQQTQVGRVIPKYAQFLERFPDAASLAGAELGEVLRTWSGLGYNRRAKFLWQAAQRVTSQLTGGFPDSLTGLEALPGIGKNTAGAILAYAFNQPAVFIETNIRTVYIHHFFENHAEVADKAVLEITERTLDREHSREWYWALMDYGSFLKQTVGSLNHRSTGYSRQSAFRGSRRQLRGRILRLLADKPLTPAELQRQTADSRTESVAADLLAEGMISKSGRTFVL